MNNSLVVHSWKRKEVSYPTGVAMLIMCEASVFLCLLTGQSLEWELLFASGVNGKSFNTFMGCVGEEQPSNMKSGM